LKKKERRKLKKRHVKGKSRKNFVGIYIVIIDKIRSAVLCPGKDLLHLCFKFIHLLCSS